LENQGKRIFLRSGPIPNSAKPSNAKVAGSGVAVVAVTVPPEIW
jgi:hypothetical protein